MTDPILELTDAQNKSDPENSRASSHILSFTRPLCAKHFSQMRAYREAVALGTCSSSPKRASASLSYHCLRGGVLGKGGGKDVAGEYRKWYQRFKDVN